METHQDPREASYRPRSNLRFLQTRRGTANALVPTPLSLTAFSTPATADPLGDMITEVVVACRVAGVAGA